MFLEKGLFVGRNWSENKKNKVDFIYFPVYIKKEYTQVDPESHKIAGFLCDLKNCDNIYARCHRITAAATTTIKEFIND